MHHPCPRKMVTLLILAAFIAISTMASPVRAEVIAFDKGWKEQGFLRLWTNDYKPLGTQLKVISDGTVSLLYKAVPKSAWKSMKAKWGWSVSQSVVPTDLTRKGGDDRNLAIYFVFVDESSAQKLAGASASKLLRNENTRALVYVWGGNYKPGTILRSPYGPKILKTVIRRPAGKGSFSENVNLVADFKRAFGKSPGVLVGVGISADSDDTDGKINAVVKNLEVY